MTCHPQIWYGKIINITKLLIKSQWPNTRPDSRHHTYSVIIIVNQFSVSCWTNPSFIYGSCCNVLFHRFLCARNVLFHLWHTPTCLGQNTLWWLFLHKLWTWLPTKLSCVTQSDLTTCTCTSKDDQTHSTDFIELFNWQIMCFVF
jgi:hypothetical protein